VSAGPQTQDDARLPVSLAAACLAAVVLRLPTFRYPLVSDDEAIYDAMAQVVTRGGVMYRDAVDHKPPGLTYTYSAIRALVEHLGGSFAAVLASVHVFGILAVVLTCVALHAVAREVLEPRLATIPPLLYAFTSAASVPPDSLAVNGELLMNLPTVVAVLFALRATEVDRPRARRVLLDIAAGALCGVAALYKYQAALVGLSFFFLLPNPRTHRAESIRELLVRGTSLAVGLVLPFLATGLYFWHRGALQDAIDWGLLFNVHYLAEGPDLVAAAARLSMQLVGVVLPSALVYGAGLWAVRLLLKDRGPALHGVVRGRGLLLVWLLESIYCVTLGRRFFGHYFLQPELPLCLLAAGPVVRLWDARPRLVAVALIAPALVFFGIAVVPELTGPLVYGVDPDFWAIGRAVAARTTPEDTIWVWGNVPQIYFTAEREPGVRFTFCNYLTGLSPGSRSEIDPTFDSRKNAVPGAWDLVVRDLDAHRPRLIVDTAAGAMKSYGKYPVASFPVLASYLAAHYRADGAVLGAVLYRRVASASPEQPTTRIE
jgi:hypothetical protein